MTRLLKLSSGVVLTVSLLVTSCQDNNADKRNDDAVSIKTFKEKKKVKDPNVRHKKGIEHMADYQFAIRKHLDADAPTYEKGYLIKEFQKAKQNSVQRKNATSLNPVIKERGPFNVPGRTRGIAVDPTDNKKWFVGTVGGGVWKTENEGATWVNLTDAQLPNLATSTIVISPQDANTLYVGTGEPFGNLGAIGGAGLFKSTDGGTTWSSLTGTSNFGDIGRIIINPTDKNNVVVAAQGGIYRTTNGGTTWSQTYNSTGWVQDLDADPNDFNIQYGSVRNFGLVKSTNGGLTWSAIFERGDYNSSHSRFETSVSSADSNTLFVSVYSSSNATVGVNTDFYVSRDKGLTFQLLNTTGSAAAANLLTGQGWYDNVIMAHPYDTNIFYVGGVAVFKVTVSGTNFTSASIASGYDNSQINTAVHVDQHGLEFIPGSGENFRILLANDGGVYSTSFKTDPGATQGDWSGDAVSKNSTQFYGATKQNGQDNYLAGAQDNGSWVSLGNNSDESKTYTFVYGGDGYEALWHYNKPGDFLVTSQYGRVGRYVNYSFAGNADIEDSGNSSIAPFYTKISNADNNPDAVFTVTARGVWRSTDFGENWNLTSISEGFAPNNRSALNVEVSTADPNVVWAGGAMTENKSSTLFVSEDNGVTFKSTNVYDNPKGNHSYNISGIGTSLTERNRAYALFSSQGAAKVLKTEDLGNTWTDITGLGFSRVPDVAVHSILEMPFDKDILWLGTDIGLFESTDGGGSWNFVNEMIPVAIYDMKIVNNQVIFATYGRGIWTATLSQLDTYEPAAFLGPATVSSVQKGIESLKGVVSYNVTDDNVNRVKVYVDDAEQTEVIQDFSTGVTYNFETSNLSEGKHKVGIQLFLDATNSETIVSEYEFDIIDFESPSQSIGITEFETSDVYYVNNGFKVDNMGGDVSSIVLNNADHPYENGITYTSILKKPLIITQANKDFTYEDLAIVEPYTDDLNDLNSFYDFVIIEGSTDLKTWKTIDKYDARRFTEWLDAYNGNATASDDLFKTQTVTLTDKGFSIGETVVLRFSLVTDDFVNSYGWAIKSIQGAVASIDEVVNDVKLFSVYPTISNGDFTIFAKANSGESELNIFDISGKKVFETSINFNQNEKQNISINVNSGIYFMKLIDANNKISSQKIIIE